MAARCINCGFLSLRREADDVLIEAPSPFRQPGAHRGAVAVRSMPVCFEGLRDFDAEHGAAPRLPNGASTYRLREAMLGEIQCDRWVKYRQGSSPKEHREMVDRQWMIDREDRRDSEMREREDRRDVLAGGRHKEQMDAIKGQHWRELAVFGGVIGLATIGAAILEGAISRGFDP